MLGALTAAQTAYGLGLRIEIEARHIPCVDGLDEKRDAVRGELRGGVPQIRDVGSFNGGRISPRGNDSRHGVHAAGLQPGCIGDGRLDTLPELGFASGNTGDASLTGAPIAGSKIEKDVLQVVIAKALFDGLRRELEWKQVFHAWKPASRRRGKPIEKTAPR